MTKHQPLPPPQKWKVCREESKQCQKPLNSILATLKQQVRFSRELIRHKFKIIPWSRGIQIHLGASVPAWPFNYQHCALIWLKAVSNLASKKEKRKKKNRMLPIYYQFENTTQTQNVTWELSPTCSSSLSRFSFSKISTINCRIQQEASAH